MNPHIFYFLVKVPQISCFMGIVINNVAHNVTPCITSIRLSLAEYLHFSFVLLSVCDGHRHLPKRKTVCLEDKFVCNFIQSSLEMEPGNKTYYNAKCVPQEAKKLSLQQGSYIKTRL